MPLDLRSRLKVVLSREIKLVCGVSRDNDVAIPFVWMGFHSVEESPAATTVGPCQFPPGYQSWRLGSVVNHYLIVAVVW